MAKSVTKHSFTKEEIAEYYEVCNDGRIFSIKHNWRNLGRRQMVPTKNKDGYTRYRLNINGVFIRMFTHRLVAMFHLPPPCETDDQIRHLDGNKLNNHYTNLMWGNAKDNAEDRDRHKKTSYGLKHSAHTLLGLERRKLRIDRELVDALKSLVAYHELHYCDQPTELTQAKAAINKALNVK